MIEPIYITGHKNPDTDSICAAIAYADLKQSLGQSAIACRIGDVNLETQFVLDKFGVDAPILIENAKSRIRDIEFDEAIKIRPNQTIAAAWNEVNGTKNKSLVIVDENERLKGVASMSSLSNVLMLECVDIRELMKKSSLQHIAEVIGGKILNASDMYKPDGRVMIPVTQEELNFGDYSNAIVLIGDNVSVQRQMIFAHCACMVIVNNHYISDEIIALAKVEKVSIIKTELDIIHVARKIYLAPPVSLIMKEGPETVNINEYVDEAAKRMSKTRYRSYPVVDDNQMVIGAVSRYHLFKYRKKKFVLVDHNELSQTIDNIEEGEIIEIVDHHRIGDIETSNPIIFRNQNLGSTCSIIYQIYKEQHIVPTKQIASLLMAAIVSDTMNFNSPTTTETDKQLAQELAQIAGLNVNEFALEMFAAAATIKNRTYSEILYNDFKEYVIEGCHIGIGQVNIMDVNELEAIHDEFKNYMEEINNINKYDLLLMAFTNVVEQGSYFMVSGKLKYIADEAFGRDGHSSFVAGFVSRKKQIIPTLADALRR